MRRLLRYSIAAALLLLLGAAGTALWLYDRLEQPYRGYQAPEQFVDVPPGAGAEAIADQLVEAGVVRDRLTFKLALWQTDGARRLQAGEYRFTGPMTAREVVLKLTRGEVHLRPITFPEGLTIEEMAQVFESSGFGPAASFLEAARRTELIAELDAEAGDLEGYLYPETYALPRDATADRLVRAMIARFVRVFDEDLRAEAAARDMTVRQVVTLASLIEKETARPDERPLVAAVYTNRLERGMGLQCDPTVIYALRLAGQYDGNLRRADLAFDSPYNTYRYPGLPPGPIAAPGRESIEAALRPAAVDYLYFVSRNDGSHVFARTLAEHNRNVREYQIRYFRQRRLEAEKGASSDPDR